VYRFVDHTAELELRIEAVSEEAVFHEALAAFAELVAREENGEPAAYEVHAQAGDRAALLAEWLQELIFLAETEDFVPERVRSLDLRPDELEATVEGRRGHPSHLVKAVTYHGLDLHPEQGKWHARVVLDV
jgi:SHS2 domain-containing protein